VLLAVAPLAVLAAPDAGASTKPVALRLQAVDGSGNSTTPGRSCADGGAGASWHYDYGTKVAPGGFSQLDSESRVHLDLHSDTQRYQNASGAYAAGSTAFLQGQESHASLLNQRGSVKLRLSSGTCAAPTLAFNGSNATGAGTWTVDSGSGAYRDVAGSGTFVLNNAEVNPGADNALDLALNGSLTIPDPALQVEVVSTYWGSLGTDYLTRRATVVFKVTNTGQGDAFNVAVQSVSSPTQGVTPVPSAFPMRLLDLPAGTSQTFQVRYQFSLLAGPCKLVLLACAFQASATVDLPDAFDVPHVLTGTASTKAPTLPPPL
jgi:hypothetical protein